jgi:cellulose synthase/poly-beta-1,6-N-acetylglucosamine synthase-like glycosyltransferase
MSILENACALAFWASGAFVAYAYLGYPLVIWLLSRWFGRRVDAPVASEDDLPTITLLIAAYNEEAEIDKRIQTALMMDYPAGKLEIVVASDGSTDATPALVRRYAPCGVRFLDYPRRRGKAAVLNAAFAQVKGEIVLLSDANSHIDPDAPRLIARWFRDPEVGVVCGRLVLTDPLSGANVDSLYWKYETFLKKCEGRLGALLGANGAIYAIRRDLFVPIPNETIVDDFIIPLFAKLRSGCAIVYERRAVAREETPPTIRSEFQRRSRIGAGGFQSIGLLWKFLHPRHGWVAFTFLSHKICRWLCPFFLVSLMASNLLLLCGDEPFYQRALFAQAGFYLASLVTAFVPARTRLIKPLRLATMFTGMNAALLVGFWRWLRGSQNAAWQRTMRLAKADVAVHA